VLVGGLGMGFTLRATRDLLSRDATVVVARDRTHAQPEPIDKDRMRWPLVLMAELGAHGEPAPLIGAKPGMSSGERASATARS
jgi:hypothetical protein